jgi:hypothetical protein
LYEQADNHVKVVGRDQDFIPFLQVGRLEEFPEGMPTGGKAVKIFLVEGGRENRMKIKSPRFYNQGTEINRIIPERQ